MSGRGGVPSVPDKRHDGDGAMIAAMALPGNSSTFLTHMVAHGLKVDRYVAERFPAMADGDIRRWKTPFLPILLHGAVSRPVSGIPLQPPHPWRVRIGSTAIRAPENPQDRRRAGHTSRPPRIWRPGGMPAPCFRTGSEAAFPTGEPVAELPATVPSRRAGIFPVAPVFSAVPSFPRSPASRPPAHRAPARPR